MSQAKIDPKLVADVAYMAIRQCATTLRCDFSDAVQSAFDQATEDDPASLQRSVLQDIVQNSAIGREQGMPICQDTGSVWVCLEVGEENDIPGNIFSELNDAVSRAYEDRHLRMSIVKDALLDRSNTNDNTPAFTDIHIVPGRSVRMHVMLKGGGSDNASRLVMLPPSAGWEGIKKEVLACVREKAANACPPLLIGVGVGGTFDKVASLAKTALLREVGSQAKSEELAELEVELLSEVNETEIGPGALGGTPTAVGVHINTAPCHIAAFPLAINMGCCAMRSASITLVDENGNAVSNPMQQFDGADNSGEAL